MGAEKLGKSGQSVNRIAASRLYCCHVRDGFDRVGVIEILHIVRCGIPKTRPRVFSSCIRSIIYNIYSETHFAKSLKIARLEIVEGVDSRPLESCAGTV